MANFYFFHYSKSTEYVYDPPLFHATIMQVGGLLEIVPEWLLRETQVMDGCRPQSCVRNKSYVILRDFTLWRSTQVAEGDGLLNR